MSPLRLRGLRLFDLSVDVLDYLVGAALKQIGMFDELFVVFERRGIVMPVADTLIGDHLDIHILAAVQNALTVVLVADAFCSVRNKDRKVAEVIDMMVDRLDPEDPMLVMIIEP